MRVGIGDRESDGKGDAEGGGEGESRQSYQKLRAACRQRALSLLICSAGMTLTGGSLKKVGDSCCTQLLILTKSSRRLPAHLLSSCAAQRSCSSLGWKTHVVSM